LCPLIGRHIRKPRLLLSGSNVGIGRICLLEASIWFIPWSRGAILGVVDNQSGSRVWELWSGSSTKTSSSTLGTSRPLGWLLSHNQSFDLLTKKKPFKTPAMQQVAK
jgi:hypothetical protein